MIFPRKNPPIDFSTAVSFDSSIWSLIQCAPGSVLPSQLTRVLKCNNLRTENLPELPLYDNPKKKPPEKKCVCKVKIEIQSPLKKTHPTFAGIVATWEHNASRPTSRICKFRIRCVVKGRRKKCVNQRKKKEAGNCRQAQQPFCLGDDSDDTASIIIHFDISKN